MHWLCFHLEFEHSTDPDEACEDASCPWRHIQFYREALQDLGQDADAVLAQAIDRYFRNPPWSRA